MLIKENIKPTLQGVEAVDALLEANPETPSYMIGVQENKITRVPLMEAVAMVCLYLNLLESHIHGDFLDTSRSKSDRGEGF